MYWYGWTATAATGALLFGSYRRVVARPLDTLVLAGVVVGDAHPRDDRVRLPDNSLVSTIAGLRRVPVEYAKRAIADIASGPRPNRFMSTRS